MWSSIVQRFSRGLKWLDLDRKTLALMFKGCIPVAISLSIYQSTPVSEVYTSLGFLVSIIAVVTVNILPRAKLIQLTFTICLWTAFAIPLAMLAAWSALQARLHTDPRGLSKYNPSQSAVTAIWLFFHIWLSNSVQARYPALLIATILYNIFMIVQFTSVATYTTWAQCWSIIYLTIRCYYTGVAISFFSGILVYPVTCRTEVFEVQERFFGAARGSLEATMRYVEELSSLSAHNQDSSSSDGDGRDDKTKTAGATLKQKVAGLKELYVKMHQELVMAKREVAWGKLRARDLTALGDLNRRILMPIQGLAHVADILQRIEENEGWMPFDGILSGHEKTAGSKTTGNTEEADAMWQASLAALIGPASSLIKVVGDGLGHAGLQLEIIPRPGSKSYVRRMFGARNNHTKADTEAADDVTRPGAPAFSRTLEEQLQRFAVERVKALDAWVNYERFTAEQIGRLYGEMQNVPKDLLRDHQQPYLLLYMQQMMYSTAIGVLDLDRFADRLVAEGVMTRNRLIVPSGRRVWKWFLSLFDTADTAVADDDRPGSKKESTLLYGKSTRKTRDIEHLPPEESL